MTHPDFVFCTWPAVDLNKKLDQAFVKNRKQSKDCGGHSDQFLLSYIYIYTFILRSGSPMKQWTPWRSTQESASGGAVPGTAETAARPSCEPSGTHWVNPTEVTWFLGEVPAARPARHRKIIPFQFSNRGFQPMEFPWVNFCPRTEVTDLDPAWSS